MHEPLPEGKEGIVYADLDLGMISLAKAAADPAGHYARPDCDAPAARPARRATRRAGVSARASEVGRAGRRRAARRPCRDGRAPPVRRVA